MAPRSTPTRIAPTSQVAMMTQTMSTARRPPRERGATPGWWGVVGMCVSYRP